MGTLCFFTYLFAQVNVLFYGKPPQHEKTLRGFCKGVVGRGALKHHLQT